MNTRSHVMATTGEHPQATLSVPEGAKTIHDTVDQKRYQLRLSLSSEMNQALEQLARRYGTDKAEVLNLAVGLLKAFAAAVDEGKRVGIATDDQELDTEITGL